ncbi:MAG: isoleucine--tRNA ligase [Gemmatimonadaceae bacterium]
MAQDADSSVTPRRFPRLPFERPIDELEREVLEWWRAEDLFATSVRAREGEPYFVWFEGPPTANGRPGIHHVFARTIKDLFCRHRAMQGHYVPRKGGWDTHGLPVEIEVEKALGISGKQEIEALGVAKFNALCRESVFTYKGDFESLSERTAVWMDYANAYVTYSNEYIESVWWALKTLYDKGRLYRGHKILPYCPRCGTALSSHEVAQGYEDVDDPSVYVTVEVTGAGSRLASDRDGPGTASDGLTRRLLIWTTTPWTLVSNVALAVHPDLAYLELRKRSAPDEGTLMLAEERAGALLGADFTDRWETVARLTGKALVGLTYRRPLDWVPIPADAAHEIIVGEEFVSAEDGSGIVHMAPAFGADDYAAGRRHGLAFLQPVNARGCFDDGIPVVGGQWVKDADSAIIDELQRRGSLWKSQRIAHAYPHCWRCGTPLLYYARESWFVRTTSFKDDMLVRNARIEWHPSEIGEGRFGEWLKNNVDWALSRDRYWGTPLPVWVSDADPGEIEVIGSFAELAARVGRPLPNDFDPHKPHVDAYTWPARSGKGTMRRVSEVIDTWFDSGSMPFAQWHFPFENHATMQRMYPADFIAEGVDQTRGWFYSLLAIASGLGDALPNNDIVGHSARSDEHSVAIGRANDTAPYRAVVVNDMVLDAHGIKMSKTRGNIVDPGTVIEQHGADALRVFLIGASQLDLPRRFDVGTIRDLATGFFLTLKNVYGGIFAQYANFGWTPSAEDPAPADRPVLDRWILSRLTSVERDVDALLTAYDATTAVRRLMTFLVDDVSNWYVRLSRRRLYDVATADNRAAFATLHEVLVVFNRLLAPFAPFIADWLHRALTESSVHLADFTRRDPPPADAGLEAAMGEARELVRLGRSAREDLGINVRRPLARAVGVVPTALAPRVAELLPLIRAELNVKATTLLTRADELVQLRARPNFRALGKKFGRTTPLAAKAIEALSNESLQAFERGEPLLVSVDGAEHALGQDDLTVVRQAAGDLVVKEEQGRLLALDPVVTPELQAEGRARELVSRIQRLRKETGFAVSDRIQLWLWGAAELESAARVHQDWIAGEVLARAMHIGRDGSRDIAAHAVDIDGLTVHVALTLDVES